MYVLHNVVISMCMIQIITAIIIKAVSDSLFLSDDYSKILPSVTEADVVGIVVIGED